MTIFLFFPLFSLFLSLFFSPSFLNFLNFNYKANTSWHQRIQIGEEEKEGGMNSGSFTFLYKKKKKHRKKKPKFFYFYSYETKIYHVDWWFTKSISIKVRSKIRLLTTINIIVFFSWRNNLLVKQMSYR